MESPTPTELLFLKTYFYSRNKYDRVTTLKGVLRSSSSQIRGQLVKSCRLFAKLPHKVFETLHSEGFLLSQNTFATTEAFEN